MAKSEFYGLYFDEDQFRKQLINYFTDWLNKQEEKLLELMKIEIDKSVAGQSAWRNELKANLKRVHEIVTNDYIEYGVGSDFPPASYEYIRAMVVSAGSGSAVENPPIKAGQAPRLVFNDSLDGKHNSQVEDWYYLPDGFNQEGHDWVSNAMKRVGDYYQNELNAALAALPNDLVWSCFKTGRK